SNENPITMKPIRVYRYHRRKKPSRQETFFSREGSGTMEALWGSGGASFFSPGPIQRRGESAGASTPESPAIEEREKGMGQAKTLMPKEDKSSGEKKAPEEEREAQKEEEQVEDCGKELSLEALTEGNFRLESYSMIRERKKKLPEEVEAKEGTISVEGKMKLVFKVDTTIHMPSVPSGLRPCQQLRVKQALKNELLPHEKEHQRIMKGFAGTEIIPVQYTGPESDYDAYLKDLAMDHFY